MTKPKSEWPTKAEYVISDDPQIKKKSEELSINFKDLFHSSLAAKIETTKTKLTEDNFQFILKLINRFEHWYKTVKFVSLFLRLNRKNPFRRKEFTLEEKIKKENFIWSVSQQFHFPEEFDRLQNQLSIPEKSQLDIYNPYLDKEVNLIKSDSRLRMSGLPEEMKTSIILPKNCPIVEKYKSTDPSCRSILQTRHQKTVTNDRHSHSPDCTDHQPQYH
jgi:hypothetical protein